MFSIAAFLLAALLPFSEAQYQTTYGPAANQSSLVGTWCSGAGHVMTGSGFANPVNRSFTYPKTAGISYSFTGDGHFELARYRFTANGSEPTCITGVIGWAHGTYQLHDNGTIHLNLLEDGFQQIQDPCAAVSNFIETYNQTEYYMAWQVYQDTSKGLTARLYDAGGAPLAPMTQCAQTPNMLPTQKLANASSTISDSSQSGQNGGGLRKRSDAPKAVDAWRITGAGALGLASLGLAFL